MTILLTLFVFMVSFSQMELAKFKALASSREQTFSGPQETTVAALPPPARLPAERNTFQEFMGLLQQASMAQRQTTAPPDNPPAPLAAPSTVSTLPLPAAAAVVPREPDSSPQAAKLSSAPLPAMSEQTTATPPVDVPSAPVARQEAPSAVQALATTLQSLVTALPAQGLVGIETQDHYLFLRLLGHTTFASGKAELRPEVLPTLRAIGAIVRQTPHEIFVAGHTDDVPIRGSIFKSNLELSAARAATVVDYLVRQAQVAPERIATMGFGEYRPLVPNTSETTRQQNRRVEIILSAKPAAPGR